MKKKKGFTLIELLAVIVVLAVLMVIAVPKILDVIENADKQAYKESAELLAHTAILQYQTSEVTGKAKKIPEEGIIYTFDKGVQSVSGDFELLKFKGETPYQGTITLTKDKKVIISDLISKNKKWCVKKDVNEKSARIGRRTDPDFNCTIEGEDEIIIKDESSCELATNDDKTEYYIDSPSDLYAFSQSVNSGNETYSGKIVKVRNNLDMKDVSEKCGETSFKPIGTSSTKSFKGTFDGGGKTISNLTINNPSASNLGLFGYVYGSSNNKVQIYGLNLENVDIIGTSRLGGVAGYASYANIYEVIVKNVNVYGTGEFIGSIVGNQNDGSGTIRNSIIKGGTIQGNNYVYATMYSSNVIIEDVNVNVLNSANRSGILWSSAYGDVYKSNTTVVNKVVQSGFDKNTVSKINFYDSAGLDTWIGGDDGSGYYFDYKSDTSDEIVIKSVERNPIVKYETSTCEINSKDDWKKAAASQSVCTKYILKTDLDFKNSHYYMLSSSKNPIKDKIFDGGAKTISNVTIIAPIDKIGLFGYVEGSSTTASQIYGLNIAHIKISANNHVGGLIGSTGYNSTLISEICAEDITVNGSGEFVNLVIGYQGDGWKGTAKNILIKSGTVRGGLHTYALMYGDNVIVENASIYSQSAKYGVYWDSAYNTYYHTNLVKVNDTAIASTFTENYINDLDYYTDRIETLYNGDVNNTGYFFDYVDEKNGIYLVKKYTPVVTDTPVEKPNCYIELGKEEHSCYLFNSGVHGNYLYTAASSSDTGTGATCTSTGGRVPAYRRKITYICN